MSTLQAYPQSLIADIQDCVDAGIVMVGAAGNSSQKIDIEGGIDFDNYITANGFDYYYHRGSWSTSAAVAGVGGQRLSICVGAVSAFEDERKTDFSNCGPRVDIYAPGDNIMSALNDGTVNGGTVPTAQDPRSSGFVNGKYDGTSMASPQVCGLAACLLEQYPNMNQDQMREYTSLSVARKRVKCMTLVLHLTLDFSLMTNHFKADLIITHSTLKKDKKKVSCSQE